MNFFRRLTADTPAGLLAEHATTSHTAEAATAPADIPVPTYQGLFATLAVLAEHPGVLTANTPGLPTPANH